MIHGYAVSWSTLVSIGTCAGMLLALWRVSVRVVRWVDSINAHLKVQDQKIEDIRHELVPNSGHSHHDQVLAALKEVHELVDQLRSDAPRPRPRRWR